MSGVGTYTTTVQLPESWTARDRGTYLDLGAVAGSVKVFVNGAKIAPDSVAGRDWDVSAHLKPGANELKVVLATPLGNTVRPAESEPYGLLGPVRLVPFGRAAVNWATGDGTVGGTVPPTLSLTLGAPASFGSFTPGIDRSYDASTTATVTSTAGDATLSVADTEHERHRPAGQRVLRPRRAAPGAREDDAFAPLGAPLTLLTYDQPVSNDAVTIGFRQHIAASQALRTGTYSKTLTFTLSTTNP